MLHYIIFQSHLGFILLNIINFSRILPPLLSIPITIYFSLFFFTHTHKEIRTCTNRYAHAHCSRSSSVIAFRPMLRIATNRHVKIFFFFFFFSSFISSSLRESIEFGNRLDLRHYRIILFVNRKRIPHRSPGRSPRKATRSLVGGRRKFP